MNQNIRELINNISIDIVNIDTSMRYGYSLVNMRQPCADQSASAINVIYHVEGNTGGKVFERKKVAQATFCSAVSRC